MRNINIDFYNSGNTIILGYTNEHLATNLNFVVPAEFRDGYSYKLIFNLENNQEYMELFASYPITYKVSNIIMSAGTSGHLQLSVLKKQDNGEVMVAQSGIIPFKVLSSLADNDTEIGEYTNTIETLIAEFVSNLQNINSRELKANKIVTGEQITNKEENYPSIQYLEDNYPTNNDVYLVDEANNKFLASDHEKIVLTKHLGDGVVTTEKIVDEAIISGKIKDESIIESKIANEAVTNSKLAKNSVTTDKIKMGSITSSKLASNSINENVLSSDLKAKINSKLDTPDIEGIAGQVLMHTGGNKPVWGTVSGGSGGTGTSNYLELENKPSINDVSLVGNITLEELGIKNGSDGKDGVGIKSIEQTTTSTSDNGINVINIVLTDDTQSTVTVRNGSKGSPGLQGEKGETGSAGKDGKDGVGIENIETSISSEDNGLNPIVITLTDGTEYTVYTKNGSKGSQGTSVKVKSVATSLEDDGNNIVKFTDGSALTIKNGSKGSQGETGDKGDKGDKGDTGNGGVYIGTEEPTDPEQVVWINPDGDSNYGLTEDDKQEIATIVKSDLSQIEPNFANSIDECTDTSKVYVLPDGYIYAFMAVESVGGIEEVTEQITGEFTEDYRLSTSSGSLSALAGAITTPLIDITGYGDKFTIHLDSANGNSAHSVQWAKANQDVTGNSMCLYKDDDLVLAGFTGSTSLRGITYNVNAADDVDISFDVSAVPIDAQGFTHVRFSGVTGRADRVAVSVTYEKEIQGGLKPDFTNLADPTSDSWRNGYRINSSMQYVEANGACTTNWFPCKTGSVIRVKGLAMARKDCNEGGIEVGGYSGFNASADGITPIVNEKASEEQVCQLFSRDADGIETLDLTNYTHRAGSFNYVCLTGRVESTEEDIIITVDEEIKYSQTIGYAWTNTGHAFVPADYENRIIDLEDDVADLKNITTTSNGVPVYVIEEAEVVADKILATRNAYSFVFGAISDTHTTGSDTSATSVLHAGMGMDKINEFTQLDLVTNFGDVMVGYLDETYKEGFKHVKSSLNSVSKAVPYIQLQGNHDQLSADTTEEAQQKYFAYIGANNVDTVTDWTNRFRNYGYRDFNDQKMRVIYLNTADVSEVENTKDVGISSEQYSWFINTALDFSNKDDAENWGFIVCSHHPLNWYYLDNLLVLLNAYKGKTSGSITTDDTSIAYDFTNATAELIAHFHGHLHNFRVEKLGENEITTITIPNACFGRNNEYGTNSSYNETVHTNFGDADENGNQRQFNKTANTAEDTAFNVVVVDRQNRKIHCFNYGAGIDREILY